jgi:UDP-2,3-diacylglucosamine pyrophosphatase LpxH
MSAAVTHLLAEWEGAPANTYGADVVDIKCADGNVFVISDLHVGAGLSGDGVYDGLENFLADHAFSRFLDWAHLRSAGRRAILVINGDFVDFIRIVTLPASDADIAYWHDTLTRLGLEHSLESLRSGITKKERQFGLKTHDYKSVFKLMVAVQGHRLLFDALAVWLNRGHQLVVTKGNHDLEWYWPAVRNYLRLVLAEGLCKRGDAADIAQALAGQVLPRLTFADNAVSLDGDVYIEHGHRYDRYTRVLGSPVLGTGEELNIPFGSFFNRYLINTVELYYPFADKVRPAENLLALMVREHFFVALKLLFRHIPFVVRIIPKRYFRYLLARALPLAAALVLPLAAVAWSLRHFIVSLIERGSASGLVSKIEQDIGAPALSYFLARIVAYLQLREPSDLDEPARELLREHSRYRLATFGHTHNPTQSNLGKSRYCNTGTWIPVIEISTADVREDRTYTFLELRFGPGGLTGEPFLQRWNDDAGRADPLVVVPPQTKSAPFAAAPPDGDAPGRASKAVGHKA